MFVMMEANFIISEQRQKNKLVTPKHLRIYGRTDCSGCEHKAKCLYKYNAEKDAEKIRS